jgi:hypothetical protein
MWPWLSGEVASSPRKELAIGGCANPKDSFCTNSATKVEGVISVQDDGKVYKLLVGEVWQDGWTGPNYPNVTTVVNYNKYYAQCPNGCLFRLDTDPTEHTNLTATEPAIVAKLAARVKAIQNGAFSPVRGKVNTTLVCGAVAANGGFWGPFVSL